MALLSVVSRSQQQSSSSNQIISVEANIDGRFLSHSGLLCPLFPIHFRFSKYMLHSYIQFSQFFMVASGRLWNTIATRINTCNCRESETKIWKWKSSFRLGHLLAAGTTVCASMAAHRVITLINYIKSDAWFEP